ncbi:MAG: hypothetical protein FWD14_07100 [Treponema sp.]|nr:hypothetical protein [Treponema sp.]
MFKIFNLFVFFVLININIFSLDLNISWNKKEYNYSNNTFLFEYQKVNEITFNTDVTILIKSELLQEIHNFIFKLYYNDDNLALQKNINVIETHFSDGFFVIDFRVDASIDYLEQMKETDTLFYKCIIEFPSGEIYESEPIKAVFSAWISTPVQNTDPVKFSDFSLILASSDNEYNQKLNFKEAGFISPYAQRPNNHNNIDITIQFDNLIPGKTYTLYYLTEEGVRAGSIYSNIPFFMMPYL